MISLVESGMFLDDLRTFLAQRPERPISTHPPDAVRARLRPAPTQALPIPSPRPGPTPAAVPEPSVSEP